MLGWEPMGCPEWGGGLCNGRVSGTTPRHYTDVPGWSYTWRSLKSVGVVSVMG